MPPIKQLRSSLLPQALHLFDRREVYKTNQKINILLAGFRFRVGSVGKGTAASTAKQRRDFGAVLLCLLVVADT
jgi:hypothetical protein